jgi:DNA-directed RNA polymerase specialized sigma24 family protein
VHPKFSTTNWSLVLAAGGAESVAARKALEALCEAYWPPLYAFIRRQGHSPDDAADLTQAYLVQLLEKRFLKDLRPEAGRFRSFLFVSVKHFLANERDRVRALKRGGGRVPFSLDVDAARSATASNRSKA